jgi:hypothetical protein
MRNNGSATWSPDTHFLGSQNPENNTTWGPSRVPVPHAVAPGQEVTFTFQIKAPGLAQTYAFQSQMFQDGAGWFGELTENVSISVTYPECNVPDCADNCRAEGCFESYCEEDVCTCHRCRPDPL